MIQALLSVTVVAFLVGLLGLLLFAARWHRAGAGLSATYALGVAAVSCAVAEAVGGLPLIHLAAAGALVVGAVLAASALRPDWNPAAQAFLATLSLLCGSFVLFAAEYSFSGALPAASLPGRNHSHRRSSCSPSCC